MVGESADAAETGAGKDHSEPLQDYIAAMPAASAGLGALDHLIAARKKE